MAPAAVEAVDAYWAAIGRIEVNPAGFSEAEMKAILGKVAGPEVVAANVGSYLGLKERGFRYDGTAVALTTKASKPPGPSSWPRSPDASISESCGLLTPPALR